MAVTDPYLINTDLSVHLRDARHAHNLFTEHSHSFSPKVKFLYHVIFQPNSEVGDAATSNTWKFQKEIGVLAKTVDLPQYRVTVENKQQYNRKKNIQTRIDYQDVTIRFHDDATGVTRSLLEEYYKYYYQDGNSGDTVTSGGSFHPRDKYDPYDATYPNYGLNNYKISPFFNFIKIYQLSRQQWFSYTLINPLLTQWGHDSLDYSDGAGMMENTISIAYEAVLYDNGEIGRGGEPATFASDETRYDNVPSPLAYQSGSGEIFTTNPTPNLLNQNRNTPLGILPRASNSASQPFSVGIQDNSTRLPGALPQITIPTAASTPINSSLAAPNFASRDLDRVEGQLRSSSSARESFVARTLNSSNSSLNYNNYTQLNRDAKDSVFNNLVDDLRSGNQKYAGIAQDAINANKG
jgi:hypothetical protein